MVIRQNIEKEIKYSGRCTFKINQQWEPKYNTRFPLLDRNYIIIFDSNELPEGMFLIIFNIIRPTISYSVATSD